MKKAVSLLLSLFIILALLPNVNAKAIDSVAHAVMVADTLELYSEQSCHTRLPIASTTKIVTAIVVLENTVDIEKEISVPSEACGIEGSSIYLYEGEKITIEALLYGLMLESGNDAAVALALAVSGSIDAFVELMNDYADSLKLKNSHFTNPHGLDDPMHYSSAYDLALIMKDAMENEDFARIASTKSISLEMPDGTKRFFSNHNRLLRMSDDIIGGKTGFTKISKRCLVSCAQRDGVRIICVTLGCSDDFNTHLALYNEAFASYQMYDLPTSREYAASIVGAAEETVSFKYNGKTKLPLRSDKDLVNVRVKVKLPRFIYAPVNEGDIVGDVCILYDGVLIESSPLIAESSVSFIENKNFLKKVIDYIRRIFGI